MQKMKRKILKCDPRKWKMGKRYIPQLGFINSHRVEFLIVLILATLLEGKQ